MRKRDAVMFAGYLVLIALGTEMMSRQPVLGFSQAVVCAVLFAARLYFILKRRPTP